MKQGLFMLFLLGVFFGYSYAESTRHSTLTNMSDLSLDDSLNHLDALDSKKAPVDLNEASRRPASRGPASVISVHDEEILDLEEENSIGKDQW